MIDFDSMILLEKFCIKNCSICNTTGNFFAANDGWQHFFFLSRNVLRPLLNRKQGEEVYTYDLCDKCNTQDNIDIIYKKLEKLKKEDDIKGVIE